jgi:Bacterial Ig domain
MNVFLYPINIAFMKRIAFVLFAGLLALSGCKKTNSDEQKPSLTITSPTNNQQFTGGQTVNITGTATDNDHINELQVKVTNLTTGSVLMQSTEHIDAVNTNISKSFTAAASSNYKVEVSVNDHAYNETKVEITVKGN